MKVNYLLAPLVLLPLCVFSQSNHVGIVLASSSNLENKNTQEILLSNENEEEYLTQSRYFNQRMNYPTQVIRMVENIENQQISCEKVHNQIDKLLVQHIANEQFNYAIFISCRYNPETHLAIEFIINSYFDPLSNEAITYLESYLKKYNGSALLGTRYNIESAKGLIISLNLASGMRIKPNRPPFTEYRKDRSNFYFKSNYEMKNELYNDIYQNFFTTEPDKVLPFLDKWIFNHAGSLYKAVLIDSNYVELQPEKIFLMENEEIFVPMLKQYFVHYCEQYEKHRCLNPT